MHYTKLSVFIFTGITISSIVVFFVLRDGFFEEKISIASPTTREETSLNPLEVGTSSQDEQDARSSTSSLSLIPQIVENTIEKPVSKKQTVYEELHTHHSDTEEGYRPTISPCEKPMSYSIGNFDTRFGISQEEFLSITKEAIAVWEKESGKALFYYTPRGGDVTLNLTYDERQKTTVDIGYLALEIANTKITADAIKDAYEKEKVIYEEDSMLFNKDAASFEERYNAYSTKVKNYNEAGGAAPLEYEAMMRELEVLKKESSELESRRKNLLLRMEEINARVKRYNELVAYVNSLIRKSNAMGSRTFTEGRFTPSTNTIDIFQYSDLTKLKRVLIHEFGHAIGIGHVEGVSSIMYSFNSGTSTTLSYEDREAFLAICVK